MSSEAGVEALGVLADDHHVDVAEARIHVGEAADGATLA